MTLCVMPTYRLYSHERLGFSTLLVEILLAVLKSLKRLFKNRTCLDGAFGLGESEQSSALDF